MRFLVNISRLGIYSIFFMVVLAHAQNVTVLDADSREYIPNVAIYNHDRSKIALTDLRGVFNIAQFTKHERLFFKHLSYELGQSTKAQIQRQGQKIYLILKPEQLDEVVLSVSKWEQQKKDIPNKIAIIDSRTISFGNPQTAADVLAQSGQVFVQKSQLGGGSPMIRGFATNRLLLSVDGVRMNNAIFRGGNVQNVIAIDPFTIHNTEVIFGPGSVIYGSDAIGGVMNFYTKKPIYALSDSTLVTGNANYRMATANTENTVHADINLAKGKWASFTSITYNNFQDLRMGSHGPESYLRRRYVVTEEGKDILVNNSNPKKQVPTGYDQLNLLQKFLVRPNTTWDAMLGLYYSETSDYSRYDRLIRPSKDELGLRSAEWYYGPQKWFLGNLQFNISGKDKFYDRLKITAAYQFFEESRHHRDFNSALRNSNREKVDALNFNADWENKRLGNFRLYYGTEYIFNKVHSMGSNIDINTQETRPAASRYPDGAIWQSLAGYINGDYKARPNLTLMSGLRYSHVWIHAAFDDTFYDFPFDGADLSTGALTGSLGLSWFPKKDLQFTLNGSTGFRAPNIDDVGKIFDSEPGSVIVPNPDLEPEYAYNAEIGVRKNFQDKLVIKAAAYYTYLVDALVRRNFTFNGETQIEYEGELSNVQAIQNAAKAYTYGLEIGVEAYFNDYWSASANLTLTKGIEEEEDGTESPARHAAPTFADLHLLWKKERFKTDVFLNVNAAVNYNDLAFSERAKAYIYALDSNGNPYAPSWYTLNFRMHYNFANSLSVQATIENITDQRYKTYSSGLVAPGRNLVLGLGYKF